jgi:hypothetical protein
MTDLRVEEKLGGNFAWLWAAVAILAVGGLMVWLAIQSDRTTTTAVVQEAPAAAPGTEAEPAELGVVAAEPEPFVGRRLQVENVEVAATLGPSAFWGDVPGANPFLVMFSPNLTQRPQLAAGQNYTVRGVIGAVNDSLLNVWVASGAILPAAQQEAGFATHYLLAEEIVP